MISFDHQKEIGLLFFHQMGRGGRLGVQGIGADQGAAQVQVLEEIFKSRDFIGLGRNLDLAAKQLRLGVQSAEELERLAVDFGGGASAFAIDGQRGDPHVL